VGLHVGQQVEPREWRLIRSTLKHRDGYRCAGVVQTAVGNSKVHSKTTTEQQDTMRNKTMNKDEM
jgi:hypothetical protein